MQAEACWQGGPVQGGRGRAAKAHADGRACSAKHKTHAHADVVVRTERLKRGHSGAQQRWLGRSAAENREEDGDGAAVQRKHARMHERLGRGWPEVVGGDGATQRSKQREGGVDRRAGVPCGRERARWELRVHHRTLAVLARHHRRRRELADRCGHLRVPLVHLEQLRHDGWPACRPGWRVDLHAHVHGAAGALHAAVAEPACIAVGTPINAVPVFGALICLRRALKGFETCSIENNGAGWM
jgi:hypothetical protein